ncbi:hypothetical protein F4680DRAFT_430391 [Xylaria scruposa]|nr:hypothetical protein F4680DRAFT_430391 [Xylaria scruposa]
MAAAFGIAASVSGIVSLGLELSTRIITYVDAVRRCDEEVNAVQRQTKNIQSSLDILKNAIPDIALKHPIAGNTVLEALKSSERELEALKEFMKTLTDSTGQPQNFNLNFKHAKKKMQFPFHRRTLEALQQRLDRTNLSLDATTRALGLVIVSSINESSANTLTQLSSLDATSTANNVTSSSIKASLNMFIPQVDEALLEIKNSLSTNLPDIQQGFASMSATILRQEESLTRRIQEAQAEFREGLSKTFPYRNLLDADPVANLTLLRSELPGGAKDLLKDLAESKDHDPPHLLNATAEQRALYRLISSPAQLEKLCNLYREKDGVEHEFTIEQRDESKPRLKRTRGYPTDHSLDTNRCMSSCICRQHHESLRLQTKIGGLSVNMLSNIRWKHLPECRYAKSEVISKSNSLCLSYNGLQWLLSKAVDVSISLCTGSGGLSITPNITIRPVVDEKRSPVFRTLKFLGSCLRTYGTPLKLMKLQLFEITVRRILKHYRCRKSSPYEVDSKGQSVMHYWIDVLSAFDFHLTGHEEVFMAMTKLLLEAGLPPLLVDDQGASPGTRLIKRSLTSVFNFRRLMFTLCEEAPEASIFHNYRLDYSYGRGWHSEFFGFRNTIEVTEFLGCGPLTTAILLGDEAKVENIIALYPSTIHEQNLMRQTPFHFATDNPRILRLLMAAASSQELNIQDENGDYALDYALRLTPTLCLNGNSWVACSNCPCIECVGILLASGWSCRSDFLEDCVEDMSHTARLKIIDHLVSERAVLKELGRRFLPFSAVNHHRLNELSVLDLHARRVSELLCQDDISIPASVRATLQISEFGWDTLHTSVYHDRKAFERDWDNQLAELLYEKWFRDIDLIDTHGFSPLSFHIYLGSKRPSYILWLIEHGANILQPFPVRDRNSYHGYRYTTYTAAQFILKQAPRRPSTNLLSLEVEPYRELVSLVAPVDRHDECRCRCVEAGCHTMKIFFKQTWHLATGRWNPNQQKKAKNKPLFPKIAENISNSLKGLVLDLSEWDRVARLALRYFTFEALDLRHTCCQMPEIQYELSDEEIVEIEDEDREKLDLLEILLEDFQIAYSSFKSQDRHEYGFTDFLTTEWSPRMEPVLADIEAIQLTENDKLKAEEIGVQWQSTLEDEDEQDTNDLGYWVKILDEFMPP